MSGFVGAHADCELAAAGASASVAAQAIHIRLVMVSSVPDSSRRDARAAAPMTAESGPRRTADRSRRSSRVLIGTSGDVYRDWRGRFYPRTLPANRWLPFYAERFDTLELNTSFYRLPTAAAFRAWRASAPDRFVFAVKASRYLTHLKRLRDPADPLRLFLRGARELGAGLGPVLFQLPGQFHANVDRLDRFLIALERQRLVRPLRAVLEVRHPSWLEPVIVDRLREAGRALCLADWRDLPVREPLTADFVYVRRHAAGPGGRRASDPPVERGRPGRLRLCQQRLEGVRREERDRAGAARRAAARRMTFDAPASYHKEYSVRWPYR